MSPDSLIQFRWTVAEGGYRFATAPDPKGIRRRWMVAAGSSYGDRWLRRTFPLEKSPALFREFADLDGSEASIIGFANEHGALTRERLPSRRPGRSKMALPGEERRIWRSEMGAMRGVLELLDAAVSGDEKQLRKWLRFEPGRIRYRTPWIRGGLSLTAESSRYLVPRDRGRAARLVAQQIINERLRERTSAVLLYHPKEATFGAHLVPADLLGALWLQSALALGREQDYRQCWQCGTWMEIVPAKARSDRVYCSDRCRQKAYRQRRQRKRGRRSL